MATLPRTIILIGRSGSGKGTQGRLLETYLSKAEPVHPVLYLESGAKFRSFIEGGSATAALSKENYAKGGLQPSFLSIWIWTDILIGSYTGREHLIVDGVPRKVNEARVLEEALRFYGLPAQAGGSRPLALFLDISTEEAHRRLAARGRHDDAFDSVNSRLGWYETDVVPAIKVLEESPSIDFVRVDGEGSVEDIHRRIVAVLEK